MSYLRVTPGEIKLAGAISKHQGGACRPAYKFRGLAVGSAIESIKNSPAKKVGTHFDLRSNSTHGQS
jgi:hypothetical protein